VTAARVAASIGDCRRPGTAGRASRNDALCFVRRLPVSPAPGMLAYVADVPAGWCGFGARNEMARLVRSRTIPQVDAVQVWSIFCFTVRVGYRRLGLGRALLDGVIEYAREHGAPALEGYPVDPGGRRIHGTAAYVGTTRMFEEAGFRRVTDTDRRRRLPEARACRAGSCASTWASQPSDRRLSDSSRSCRTDRV
jgi:GNAT superfamily N-acetyltransferase